MSKDGYFCNTGIQSGSINSQPIKMGCAKCEKVYAVEKLAVCISQCNNCGGKLKEIK